MKFSLGYITAPTKTEAKKIVRALLNKKLIACANILSGVESFYIWANAVRQEKEVVIVIKTQTSNEDEVVSEVEKLHSYECPCVVFVPVTNGNKDYLLWIKENS